MREWWEFRGICMGCKAPVEYFPDYAAACCPGASLDTSWQSRVNRSNERWRPGYVFKTEKNSGYRTYQCYYGVDRNGKVVFQGGVRCKDEKATVAGWQEKVDASPAGNWYPGCELEA